jgi:RNA polymerase I-specific transcription initiation factor RRN5
MEPESVENDNDASLSNTQSRQSFVKQNAIPKKRKLSQYQETPRTREAEGSSQKKMKAPRRLRGQYNDEYRQLLNASISDATRAPHHSYSSASDEDETLEESQISLSVWSPEQKDALFYAVARYGRDDLPRLASVTRKSEPEVYEYLQLVHTGMLELNSKRKSGIRTLAGQMPAAFELSNECCDALELTGDALAWLQNTWEIKQEQKEHGDYWLLNREVADGIDTLFARDTESEDESMNTPSPTQSEEGLGNPTDSAVLEAVPAANLLNLTKFIDLAERIFMNSTDPEGNWRSFEGNFTVKPSKTESGQLSSVSILNTAFTDFHRVIVNLTRRLVHVAIFQATTRLRATDSLQRKATHEPYIKRRDVVAALRIVGVKSDSIEYWALLPERHKLNWFYQKHHDATRKREISSEEARRYLERPLKRIRPSDGDDILDMVLDSAADKVEDDVGERLDRDHVDDKDDDEDDELGNEYSSEEGSINGDSAEDTGSEGELSDPEQETQTQLGISQLEETNDNYLNLFDANNSRIQEVELWKLLQQDAPDSIDLEPLPFPEQQPKRAPLLGYGTPYTEWRDWTERQMEWEGTGEPSDEDNEFSVTAEEDDKEEASVSDILDAVDDENVVLEEFSSSECPPVTDSTVSD